MKADHGSAAGLPVPPGPLPLALYLHFPWCVQKCPYCDFNSHALRGELPEDAYVEALLRDLEFELAEAPETRPVGSVFMGGGTPSLFSGAAIARLLEQLAQRLCFAPDIEITLEANPGAVDVAHFRAYRDAGVNRLSIGAQSMEAAKLQSLGRIHDPQAVIEAVRAARAARLDNFNLDLMFALPGQNRAEARLDLEAALALEPAHLSYYQLTLEPNTEFAAHPPELPPDEEAWAMQLQGLELLAQAGLARYEVSAYARPGAEARHNLNYWTFGDYLGLGAGAHAKRSGPGGVRRRARHKHPRLYLEYAGGAQAVQEDRHVSAADLPFEFVMNALRLDRGFVMADYGARTGLPFDTLRPAVDEGVRRGLLRECEGRVAATALGLQHLNTVLTLFLP